MGPKDRKKEKKRAEEEKKRQERASQAESQGEKSEEGPLPEEEKRSQPKVNPAPQIQSTKQTLGKGKKPTAQLELPDNYKRPEPEDDSEKTKKKKKKKKKKGGTTDGLLEGSDSEHDDAKPKDSEPRKAASATTDDITTDLSLTRLSSPAATHQAPMQRSRTEVPHSGSTSTPGPSRSTAPGHAAQGKATSESATSSAKQAPTTEAKPVVYVPLPGRPKRIADPNRAPSQEFLTNHFRFMHRNATWYRYTSIVTPSQNKKGKIRSIYTEALKKQPLNGMAVATDYSSILITANRIPGDAQDVIIQVRDSDIAAQGRVQPNDSGNHSYNVTITFAAEIQFSPYANGQHSWDVMQNHFSDPDGILQAINIVLSRGLTQSNNIKRVGQQKYYPHTGNYTSITELPAHTALPAHQRVALIDAIRGFSFSAKGSKQGMLINAHVKTGAFWKARDLELSDAIGIAVGNNPSVQQLRSTFCTVRVSTKYRTPPHQDFHTITGFSEPGNPHSVASVRTIHFQWTHNQQPQTGSLEDYVAEKYNITLKQINYYEDWAVQCGVVKGNPVFIPSQLCRIEPRQPWRGTKTPIQNARMLNIAELTPVDNQNWLKDNTVPCINFGLQQSSFGELVETTLLKVGYQVLTAPTLYYEGAFNQSEPSGSWNLTRKRFRQPKLVPEWRCIWIQNKALTDQSDNRMFGYLQQINVAMNAHGLEEQGCRMDVHSHFKDVPKFREYEEKRIHETLERYSATNVKLVIVLAEGKLKSSTYSALKSLADIRWGLHLACMVPRWKNNDSGPQEDMFSNFVAKINLKLGGATHLLYDDRHNHKRGIWVDTMFVGIDTSHPSVGSADNAPTIAAVVANYHNNCVQWPASIRKQEGKKEIVTDMKDMMKERLVKWNTENGSDPKRIVVYRDGVSEGQYQEVLRTELVGMREAIEDLCSSKVPLTLVIATKRHHTRFFMAKDASNNPKPGTVVDSDITLDTMWDFFLQSHTSPKGTAKNTRYVIIHNDLETQILTAAKIQEITYELCYLYGKACRSLSICPPAHYAHLACERGRRYLNPIFDRSQDNTHILWHVGSHASPQVHANLKDTMFYL